MSITVLDPGPLTTVQDAGRVGYAAQGYRSCGAADGYAYRLGNVLVGNDPGAAVLECTLRGADILSDGIVPGSVQVSADGQPIVMLADHQTTGGYAKIATVISADLPALAQLRPGQRVCFTFVTPSRAVQAARQQAALWQRVRDRL